MSTEKKVVKCVPKLPKSVAREYNLKTFIDAMDINAIIVCYDKKFQPTPSEDGWCSIHANLQTPPHQSDYLDLRAHCMEVIECGFDIRVPPGHDLYFRPATGSKWLLTDASNLHYSQRRVRVNVINFSATAAFIRHGDLLGEVCVRPTGNIPITLETEE